jgi:allantoinase
MPLEENFLQYNNRRHGMDHDRYPWSPFFERPALQLQNDNKVALLVTVILEFFPLNPAGKPFKAPGSMVTSYPDFRHYTTRDYGNRIGIYRILKALAQYNIKANMAVNAAVAERYPSLIKDIVRDGHEIVAHGVDMDTLHYGGMDSEVEKDQINQSTELLKSISGQEISGWLSPAYSESFETIDLLADQGYEYVCDWSNDDLPYKMNTKNGNIIAMPVSQEISDRQILINNHHTEDSFYTQVCDQYDVFSEESKSHGGRVLSLTLTPYISGLPFRIGTVEEIFKYVMGQDQTTSMTGSQICKLLK